MNRCLMFRIRILLISWNGFQITLRALSAIFHQRDLRWLLLLSEILLLFRKCLRELRSNSQLCSEERHSYIGTRVRVWMRWNSQRLNLTWMIWFRNINNIRMLLLKKKTSMMKKKNRPSETFFKECEKKNFNLKN